MEELKHLLQATFCLLACVVIFGLAWLLAMVSQHWGVVIASLLQLLAIGGAIASILWGFWLIWKDRQEETQE